MKWLIPAALVVAFSVWLARRSLAQNDQVESAPQLQDYIPYSDNFTTWADDPVFPDEPDQSPTFFESLAVTLNPANLIAPTVPADIAERNEKAFLDMLAYSEGTMVNGYYTLFGGGRMDSLDDHPAIFFDFQDKSGKWLKTSAAGRYQFLLRTWRELAAKLGLTDFGPANQDRAALELVRQRGALNDVRAGRFTAAVAKCAPIWASLPGAGYNQPERKLTTLVAQFRAAGGTLEA